MASLVGVIVAVVPVSAAAHVEVSGQPARAGAPDAVVVFDAESESPSAGITRLEILADPAIPSTNATLVEGPPGWQLGPSSSGGFVVEGPALPAGEDGKVSIRVKRLPDAPQVVFKVLQSYSNGQVDRWIGLPGADGREPASPAPILSLAAAAPSPSAAPSPTLSAGVTGGPSPSAPEPAASPSDPSGKGPGIALFAIIGLVVVLVVATVVAAERRRREHGA